MAALVLQYAVGMFVNLFVAFPDGLNEGQLWEFAWSQPPLAAHIVLAFLLLFGAIVLCVRAAKARDRAWIWPSFIALLSLFAAGASGARFIPTQTDLYSYSMALEFLIAFLSYGYGLYLSKKSLATL